MNTMQDLFQYAQQELKDTYPQPEVRALCRMIFQDVFHYTKIAIHLNKDVPLDKSVANKFIGLVGELKSGRPIQYILGETEFAGMRLALNGETLIPRPETEELLMWLLELPLGPGNRLLDIGTGSGCIALGAALHRPGLAVTGIDISPGALAQAGENARALGVEVLLQERDILHYGQWEWPGYDVVVSNPPYVRRSEQAEMMQRVLDHEPHRALFVPDADPLLFYRSIASFARRYLVPGGWLYLEINEAFGRETVALLEGEGFVALELRRDLFGKERMVRGMKPVPGEEVYHG